MPPRFLKDKKHEQNVDKVANLCKIILLLIPCSKVTSTVSNAKNERCFALPKDVRVEITRAEVISQLCKSLWILFKICCRPPRIHT